MHVYVNVTFPVESDNEHNMNNDDGAPIHASTHDVVYAPIHEYIMSMKLQKTKKLPNVLCLAVFADTVSSSFRRVHRLLGS